ncbi:Panacea domain-containing protein [Sporomusa paucivorans]|uniref:Panacea domain-containing protein n=1 Tax=Sporomusa paucivorans TaxID=2376 RepID=UPI0035712601
MAKASVYDIVAFFLALAQDVGESITHMKLQKLLYYSQAWHIAMYGESLFDNKIEAWKLGPVCPEVYKEYKQFGSSSIPFPGDCPEMEGCLPIVEKRLDIGLVTFLRKIADDYMSYSAYELSSMTHNEQPWIDANIRQEEITFDAMRAYYGELVLTDEELDEIQEGQIAIQSGFGLEWKPGMFS